MAARGVETETRDALTAARFELTVNVHLLTSTLQRLGVSFAGARQFAQGEVVTNVADRKVLARVLSGLLQRSTLR